MSDAPSSPDTSEPLFHVSSGQPDPEHLAALTAVIGALAAAPARAPLPDWRWSAGARASRRSPRPGPGAWQVSLR